MIILRYDRKILQIKYHMPRYVGMIILNNTKHKQLVFTVGFTGNDYYNAYERPLTTMKFE